MDVSIGQPTPSTTEPTQFSVDSVPEDLRSNKYWEGVKTMEDLHRQFDGLQKKLGRSTSQLPPEGSSPEDWNKFYKAAGRPDEASGYEKEAAGNSDFMNQMRDVFHQSGLTADQGKAITEAISGQYSRDTEAFSSLTEKQGERAAEIAKGLGEGHESIMESAKKVLEESEAFKMLGEGEAIDPVSMSVFSGVINELMNKYNGDDTLGDTNASASAPKIDLDVQLHQIMSDDAYRNEFHPLHNKARDQARNICQQMADAKTA